MEIDARRDAPGRRSGAPADGSVEPGDLFRLAMAHTAIGMIVTDPDGVILEVNESAAEMLGGDPASLRGREVGALAHPDERADVDRLVADVRESRTASYQVRRRWVRSDGSRVVAQLTVSGVRGRDGALQVLLGQAVDVTRLEEAEAQARESAGMLRGVIDTLMDPWVLLAAVRDGAGRIVDFEYRDANEAACRANRMSREELLGSRFLSLLPGHVTTGLFDQYVEAVETGRPVAHDEHPWVSDLTDGRTRYFDNRAVKVGDGLSFTWRDVTTRAVQRQRLAEQALTDPLTGLANRRRLEQALEEACHRSTSSDACAAVLSCDLDGLKGLNDTYGHPAGDRVLQAVAERMTGAVRLADVVARIGGDEFVVLAEGVRDHDHAVALAVKLADAVSRPVHVGDGVEVVPTLSIGVALGRPGLTPADVLDAADQALYRHKREGRGLPAQP